MWFLTLISYIAILVQIIFITIAIAAGLYYLAELVEEYTTVAKKLIWWMNAVIAYFTLFLWLVPFALFVSLSANDNVLPTTTERLDGDVVSNYFSKRNKKYGLLTFFNYAKDTLLPVRTKKGF
ncbi:hypothetical protein NQ314_009030 [Rhamnusium bicolor]|uniref:Protein TEX261 n=1 Tax=Rhamnusium bicolor TaxID=1586634 RepID=A0AAV8Y6D9_9CUCU|nr:hypothetical protein NQ314_009030 [Rhamnusium bicolor]